MTTDDTCNDPDSLDDVPPYIEVADIVRVSRLSENVVREHCKGLKIAEKIGNKLLISTYDLRDRWPSLYRILLAKAAEGAAQRPPKRSPPRKASAA